MYTVYICLVEFTIATMFHVDLWPFVSVVEGIGVTTGIDGCVSCLKGSVPGISFDQR